MARTTARTAKKKAAAKAATHMLVSGEVVGEVSLVTPAGICLYLEVEDIVKENNYVSCAVVSLYDIDVEVGWKRSAVIAIKGGVKANCFLIITVSHEKIFSFAKTKNLYFFAKINIVFLRSMPYTKLLKRKEYAC